MVKVILFSHIILAVSSLTLAALVASASRSDKLLLGTKRARTMWQVSALTIASGLYLSILTHASIAKACFSSFAILSAVGLAQIYLRRISAKYKTQS